MPRPSSARRCRQAVAGDEFERRRGRRFGVCSWLPSDGSASDDAVRFVEIVGADGTSPAAMLRYSAAVVNRELLPRHASRCAYSITSSASASSDTGILMPKAFAVLRLITSSTFVDLLNRQVGGLRARQNTAGVGSGHGVGLLDAAAVTHQAAGQHELPRLMHRRHRIARCQGGETLAAIGEKVSFAITSPATRSLASSANAVSKSASVPRIENMELKPKRTSCRLQAGGCFCRVFGVRRIDQQAKRRGVGQELVQHFEPFRRRPAR